ncbi:MAG: ThiF family adenylyltransferase [Thermodesulfobacteriota bacterium]
MAAGVSEGNEEFRLIGNELLLPQKPNEEGMGDYVISDSTICRPRISYRNLVLYESIERNGMVQRNFSLIDIHCHPFAAGKTVAFSSMDEEWQRKSADHFFNTCRFGGTICFLVIGSGGAIQGKVYRRRFIRKGGWIVSPLDRIVFLDAPYREWTSDDSDRTLSEMQRAIWNRQIMAIGETGQAVLARKSFALVGVGGIGSIVAEGLARLGVTRFLLIDPDAAEPSNLNRFSGMSRKDAQTGKPKTAIAAREIRKIHPNARIIQIREPVQSERARKKLKSIDAVVLSTDNLLSRHFTNVFCLQYGIPLFSLGSVINIDGDTGKVKDMCCSYVRVLPGENAMCLHCSGNIDDHALAYELSPDPVRQEGVSRGYVNDAEIHQPAVRQLNGTIADLALFEILKYFTGFNKNAENMQQLFYEPGEKNENDIRNAFEFEDAEGLIYDQLRYKLVLIRYLFPCLKDFIDGVQIDIKWIDGRLYYFLDDEGPMVYEEECTANSRRLSLNDSCRKALKQVMTMRRRCIERKKNCPYCGENGIIGKADNEILPGFEE